VVSPPAARTCERRAVHSRGAGMGCAGAVAAGEPARVHGEALDTRGQAHDRPQGPGTCEADSKGSERAGPASGSTAAADEEDWSWHRVVLDKYKVRGTDVLGIGNFSVVRRGTDSTSGATVAIKSLKQEDDRKFRREVFLFEEIFRAPHHPGEPGVCPGANPPMEGPAPPKQWRRSMTVSEAERAVQGSTMRPPGELFVRLLDHSPLDALAKGQPCYCIQELGQFTLDELIVRCGDAARSGSSHSLSAESELLRVLLSILSALLLLNSRLLIHGDLKPANVMWFGAARPGSAGAWKLIDLDGVLTSAQLVDMRDADFYTPIYAAPELAHAVATGGPLRVSRRLDIWAAGATVLAMELLRPPLWGKFEELCAADEEGGAQRFMEWLSEAPSPAPIPSAPRAASRELVGLLRNNMLAREPACRSSPAELLAQPVLHSIALQGPPVAAPPTLAPAPPAPSRPKPPTAFQLYQELRRPELEAQGLRGPKLLQEVHRHWKQLLQEGGEELDSLRRREAELREAAGLGGAAAKGAEAP